MFVLIDNYDSFTFNLSHYLGELGADVAVHRNDAMSADAVLALKPEGIVISPGPCDPDRAGICLDLVAKAAGKVPLLGVCLGHQCIGQAFGASVVRAPKPMHGKVSTIDHDGTGVFRGVESPFTATRYHSLTLEPGTIKGPLRITARSEDGVVQGVAHTDCHIFGVQFHPESIASEHGHVLLRNFMDLTKEKLAA
ncbi:MAG: aminodeoxychorismate/anthranilate synthase component II [Rhodospirillaceae bacterium]